MFYYTSYLIFLYFCYFYLFPDILEFWCLVTVTFTFTLLYNNIYRKKIYKIINKNKYIKFIYFFNIYKKRSAQRKENLKEKKEL